MTALVVTETVLLVLLLVLVAGLLRSHAELLRRLGPAPADDALEQTPTAGAAHQTTAAAHAASATSPVGAAAGAAPAAALVGRTPDGGAVKLVLQGRGATLLAFMSSGCEACRELWSGLRDSHGAPELPRGARVVVVAQDAAGESPARLAQLAGERATVVLSSAAWERFGVSASPYFVYLDDAGVALGEGTASGWPELGSLISDAVADARLADGRQGDGSADGQSGAAGARRGRRVDATLAAAGIGPGHWSLYPNGDPERGEKRTRAGGPPG